MTHLVRTITLLTCLALSACMVGPDYVGPQMALPDAWQQAATEGMSDGTSNLHTWWTLLGDPTLNQLIQRAGAGNLDLVDAFGRVRQARALRGIATGERYPDLDSTGAGERTRTGDDFAPPSIQAQNPDTLSDVGVDASWEIDLWGRITRNIESADASLEATVEDYRDVLVLLYAEVAQSYVNLRALQSRLDFALQNVQTQRGTLQLTRDRFDAEIVPELDVRQAEQNLASTEAFVPQLRAAIARSVHRINVLLGQQPGSVDELLAAPAPTPAPPAHIDLGIPTELLRQRPDIRRAERDLAAQTARIGVATAELYPTFSLAGSFAYISAGGSRFDAEARNWSYGPNFRWNLFDGGRVRNAILLEEERTASQLARYEQTILLALEDVENSLVDFQYEQIRRDALERSAIAASQSVDLVRTLYLTGLTDFQNVLDSERSLFQQQDALAQSEGNVTQNFVAIYRALGGGWRPDSPPLSDELRDQEVNGEPIF